MGEAVTVRAHRTWSLGGLLGACVTTAQEHLGWEQSCRQGKGWGAALELGWRVPAVTPRARSVLQLPRGDL